mgnify:FL=1
MMNLAQTYLLANVLSEYSTGLSLWNFLSSDEKVGTSNSSSNRITLNELMRSGGKTHYGTDRTEAQLVFDNMKENGWKIAGSMIAIPFGFKMANKLLGKQIINPTNRFLKNTLGITEVKL